MKAGSAGFFVRRESFGKAKAFQVNCRLRSANLWQSGGAFVTSRSGQAQVELGKSVQFRRAAIRHEVEHELLSCSLSANAAHVRMLGATGIVPHEAARQVFDKLK